MRIWFALAFAALAGGCKKDEGTFPILTGGGPGGVGGGPDAASIIDGNDAGPVIIGLVCLLPDPRDLTTCATTGVGGLGVTLDGVVALTADDGTFAMPVPNGTNLVWTVQNTTLTTTTMAVIPSLMGFSAIPVIPVINADLYHDLQLSNGVIDTVGQGAIIARVLVAGVPLAGVIASSTPSGFADPAYDANNASQWNHNFTGPHGTLWLAGLMSDTPTTLTLTPNGGTTIDLVGIPVASQAITFVTIDVPQ